MHTSSVNDDTPREKPASCAVLLGGHDLEMVEIARLLATRSDVTVYDRGLRWGAKASAYLAEIKQSIAAGLQVILVELADDLPPDFPRDLLIWVDHHGPLAGADKPTAIEQVFALLAFPPERWTRDLALVTANDLGHIPAMLAIGATPDEVRDIRTHDRRAQGVTAHDEELAREAIVSAQSHLGGRLTVVWLPHSHTSAVTDFMHPSHGGPGYQNLLVLCPGQTLYFGSGQCIDALRAVFPGGWFGGELPTRGYWGIGRTIPLLELLPLVESPP